MRSATGRLRPEHVEYCNNTPQPVWGLKQLVRSINFRITITRRVGTYTLFAKRELATMSFLWILKLSEIVNG